MQANKVPFSVSVDFTEDEIAVLKMAEDPMNYFPSDGPHYNLYRNAFKKLLDACQASQAVREKVEAVPENFNIPVSAMAVAHGMECGSVGCKHTVNIHASNGLCIAEGCPCMRFIPSGNIRK